MNTLLTLHLVNIQPVFLFFIFLAVCLVAVSWMLVIKSSRYKELQEDLKSVKAAFMIDIANLSHELKYEKMKLEELASDWSRRGSLLNDKDRDIQIMRDAVKNMEVSYNDIINAWKGKYDKLKSSLPKTRERDNDGKFIKGSSRLDNLRKHLLEGNRTDRFTAQESFGIAHVGKFISTLKKEGFDIRKEKRKIAKDSFLTEYYLVPEKEAREWTPTGNYEGIQEGLYDGLKGK